MAVTSSIEVRTTFSLDDRNWRPFPLRKLKELGVAQNELWGNDTTHERAVVFRRSRNWPESALSKASVDYLQAALQEGRITEAWVVLVERDTNEVVTIKPLAEVVAALLGVEPRTGPHGPYWWMNDDLTPQYVQDVLPYASDKIPF
jgi:hypothetical protein